MNANEVVVKPSIVDNALGSLANKLPLITKENLVPFETGPAIPDQIGRAVSVMAARLRKDAQSNKLMDRDVVLQNKPENAGGSLWCRYLSADESIQMSIGLRESVSDGNLLEAYQKVRESVRKELEARRALGLLTADEFEQAEASNTSFINTRVGDVTIRPGRIRLPGVDNWVPAQSDSTAGIFNQLINETWTIFKVVNAKGEVEWKLRTDETENGPNDPDGDEGGWSVGSWKLSQVEKLLQTAQFQKGRYRSREEITDDIGYNPLVDLIIYKR